jgi:hypothetical protein
MAGYRLYFMDRDDHIKDAVELDCVDDDDAVRQAEDYRERGRMELWRRARVVMKFFPTGPGGPSGP